MELNITFLLLISSLILSFFYIILNRKPNASKSLCLPPGPPKLPIIGNLHNIAGLLPHHAFRDLSKKYGPIMHVQLGQISAVVISSPRLAKEVFKTNDIALASRPYSLLADIILYGATDVAFGSYGAYWRQMKKIITIEVLSAKKVRSCSKYRDQEMENLMEFVRSSCGKPVVLREKLTLMMANMLCKSSFGTSFERQDVLIQLVTDLGRLVSGFYIGDFFPEIGFISVVSGMKSKLMKIHKTIDETFEVIFVERKIKRERNGGEAEDDDLLDALLTVKETGGLEFPITDDNIKAVFVNIFSGGTDTSAAVMEWAMTEMMRNPDVMDKAQKEVREAFKGKNKITDSDLQDLVYLKYVIKETLRLHPPVPLLLPRECREHCQINGYNIPVKTKVFVNAYACGVDPEYWDDAESFKPERFDNSSVDFMGTHFEFIPFGAGRRICPGINFGLISIEFALAHMLYYFNWKLPGKSSPADIDMTENHGASAVKKIPLLLTPTLYSLL